MTTNNLLDRLGHLSTTSLVDAEPRLRVHVHGRRMLDVDVLDLKAAWKAPLRDA